MEPSTSVRLSLLMTLTLIQLAVTSDPPCIQGCTCGQVFTDAKEKIFHVQCGYEEKLQEVPDLSGLTSSPGPLGVSLVLPDGGRLRPDHLPKALPLARLEVFGDVRLEADVFQDVGESLAELRLQHVRLDLHNPLSVLGGLSRLSSLHLRNITVLPAPDAGEVPLTAPLFQGLGLDSLRHLSITDTALPSLGPDVLRGLRLDSLVLANNGLTRFPGAALRQVAGLKSLSLSGHRLGRLRSGDTEGLCLSELRLEGSGLEALEEGSLSGLGDCLLDLDLSNNRLSQVPAAALSPLRRLRELDLVDNNIVNVTGPLQGSYCLKHLMLGNMDDSSPLSHIAPDALDGGGRCVEFLTVYGSQLSEFPSAALRVLERAQSISLDSRSLSLLRSGALAGVHAWSLSLQAPLTSIEAGAFLNMTFHPLSLDLRRSRLTSLDFFFDYPAGTFLEMYVDGDRLPCSCRLAEVQYNLELYPLHSPAARFMSLAGECVHAGQKLSIQGRQFRQLFSACGNFTVLPLRPDLSGSGGLRSWAALVVSLLVAGAVCGQRG